MEAGFMDQGYAVLVETILRIALGIRFLSSGLSNVSRWPHATETAKVVFPRGSYFFGLVGVALMVLGGAGLAVGFHTRISALMLIVFLIPTFQVQRVWIKTLPERVEKVGSALSDERLKVDLRFLGRHAIHGHESAWKDNAIFLLAAVFFFARGSVAFALDNFLK
jgi:uncharacterized membrane protein YphA (DoxX/SURF4 family)